MPGYTRSRSRYAFGNKKRYRPYTPSSRSPFSRSSIVRNPSSFYGSSSRNALYKQTMPTSMRVILKYTGHFTAQPSAGLSSDQVFRLNSIHDPDLTNAGHQPQGHDQWNFLYGRYRVDKCVVQLIPANVSGGSASGYLSMHACGTSTAITDPVVASESPKVKTTMVNNGAHNTPVWNSYSMADLAGLTHTQYNSDDLNAAAFGSSPSNGLFLHVTFVDAGLSNATVAFQVNLSYYVTLFSPLQLAQS